MGEMEQALSPEQTPRDIIVIGASSGGIEALKVLVETLPADLPAAVFFVIHIPAEHPSFLPQILSTPYRTVAHGEDGAPIERGKTYIAPPNRHLLLERGHMHLSGGPRENRHRPSINALFRSAALAYGPRVIGVVLTGCLDDGTLGLWEVKHRGGIAIVQDPEEARYPQMPQNAIANVQIDYIVKLGEMPPLLTALAGLPVSSAAGGNGTGANVDMEPDHPALTCPECRGPLEEQQSGPIREFRCRVGHLYSPSALLEAHADTLERTLWAGVVALEEGADISRELQPRLSDRAEQLQREEKVKRQMAARLREIIHQLIQETAP